jgi:hypothetical protein
MPAAIPLAVGGAALVGGIYSSNQASNAANKATNAQTAANQAAMEQQAANLAETRKLLAPYVQVGTSAIGQQGNLIGLGGDAAQQSAIAALQNSPYFTSQLQAGQNAILQNASATGGLRGGNTQAALAQFAPQLLAQTIQNQFGNLGQLTSIGQNAAAGVGNAGANAANQNTALLQSIGNSQASGALAQGQANIGLANSAMGALGAFGQLGGFGSLGSASSPTAMTGASGLASGGYYVPSTF